MFLFALDSLCQPFALAMFFVTGDTEIAMATTFGAEHADDEGDSSSDVDSFGMCVLCSMNLTN